MRWFICSRIDWSRYQARPAQLKAPEPVIATSPGPLSFGTLWEERPFYTMFFRK